MPPCASTKSCRSKPACCRGEIPPAVAVRMNGLDFHADLLAGQKTGIFLDQRENYLAAARYARGQSARLLHLHRRIRAAHGGEVRIGGSGGQSRGGAGHRRSRTARANGIANVEFREADVFDLLAGYASARREFSTGGARSAGLRQIARANLEGAARGYKEINLRALRLLGPGGVLVTCSCSHHVSEAMLLEIVAAAVARRRPQTARARAPHASAGPSHPADGPGDALSEMPDPAGSVSAGRRCADCI